MTRQTANLMMQIGPRHWPAGALLWKARKAAAKKAGQKADSRKANAALRKCSLYPRIICG